MSQYMSQGQHELSVIADDFVEIHLVLIGHHLHDRSEYKAVESIDHRHTWKFSSIATQEPTAFVIILLTRICDV